MHLSSVPVYPPPPPYPQPPHPQPRPVCAVRGDPNALGQVVFHVVTPEGTILGTFQNSHDAVVFAEHDPRCYR